MLFCMQVFWFAAWLVLVASLSIVWVWFVILHTSLTEFLVSPGVTKNVLRVMWSGAHILKSFIKHGYIYLDDF